LQRFRGFKVELFSCFRGYTASGEKSRFANVIEFGAGLFLDLRFS